MDRRNSAARAKTLGAYYTPRRLAKQLCRRAIRLPTDSVLDPSCGEGVFLAAAAGRLLRLGADPRRLPDQIAGVDIDPSALARAHGALLSHHPSLRWGRILQADFLAFAEEHIGRLSFTAVVGNPPYIRYQKFTSRDRAAALALRAGVRLSREAASWAPF
ncbi:MAG: N-6 DNA methylase, partial [Planctomycetota bacterium]